MSLLRVLHERRGGRTPTTPPRLWRLLAGLLIVILMIWMATRIASG
jgi:hypothetical protein